MRIVAFNMRAGGSLDHWREMLARLAPEVALVQETRDPRPFARELGLPSGQLPRRNSHGEQRFLRRTEREAELINAWRSAHPDLPLPQTLRWSRDPVTAYHRDEILVPGYWAPTIRAARVHEDDVWARLSDHNPVSVDLDWPRRRPRRLVGRERTAAPADRLRGGQRVG